MSPLYSLTRFIDLIRQGYDKPPHVIARWVWRKINARRTAKSLPKWQRWLGPRTMAAGLAADNFDALSAEMETANPFPGLRHPSEFAKHLSEAEKTSIGRAADAARAHRVDLLGSGPVDLGPDIEWALDFKANVNWPMNTSLKLPVIDPKTPSDIKVPWELSRLQWLLPVGQRYVLAGDEDDATFLRHTIDDWIAKNPVCRGPNWMCAMDVALRAISMVWLFHACKHSPAWRSRDFRERLIASLILHGRFVEGNLEHADVNGNHLTADLAGLTIIGIALGGRGMARKWIEKSWQLLTEELPVQVPADGVCREAAAPYHRLVAELFALPALARRNVGLDVANEYRDRVRAMAVFTEAATGPDGHIPVWGDADDGRALPLGGQSINDHRYLVEILRHLDTAPASPRHAETLWWLGTGSADARASTTRSCAFEDAGVHVLRDGENVVFVDAGPVGMAGRGGHGHNDCLAFDACLDGRRLIVDPGTYVYTADLTARNRFRSTSAHNTPRIDGEEINRFVRPEYLWLLHDDAKPEIRHWSVSDDIDLLVAAHSGYERLNPPVTPVRGIMLEKSSGRLFVVDGFEGSGEHQFRIPFTFAPDVIVDLVNAGVWRLRSGGKAFLFVSAFPDIWREELEDGDVSPSYGVKQKTKILAFERSGTPHPFAMAVIPEKGAPPHPVRWLTDVVKGCFPVPGLE